MTAPMLLEHRDVAALGYKSAQAQPHGSGLIPVYPAPFRKCRLAYVPNEPYSWTLAILSSFTHRTGASMYALTAAMLASGFSANISCPTSGMTASSAFGKNWICLCCHSTPITFWHALTMNRTLAERQATHDDVVHRRQVQDTVVQYSHENWRSLTANHPMTDGRPPSPAAVDSRVDRE